MWLKTYLILKFRTGLRTVSAVLCSRRPGNKSAMNRHSADASRHSADASRHSAASVESSNHVDASLKTCVESLSAVRRLHKDLASHIEVCLLCCWVCRVCTTVLKVCRKSVTKVCWYNWRSAGFLGWPFPVLKYKYTNKIYGSGFVKQHSETAVVWNYQDADCSFKNNFIVLFIKIYSTLHSLLLWRHTVRAVITVVSWAVCLFVCWTQPWAIQKWLHQLRCHFGYGLVM